MCVYIHIYIYIYVLYLLYIYIYMCMCVDLDAAGPPAASGRTRCAAQRGPVGPRSRSPRCLGCGQIGSALMPIGPLQK